MQDAQRLEDRPAANADRWSSRSSIGAADPIARLVNVNKSFGRQRVLRRVSVDFLRGKTTVVMGPSGCGKTVMIKHIIGLLRPDLGEVWFDGIRVDQQSEAGLVEVRRRVGFLFQQGALFDSMSVRENVEFPLIEHTALEKEQRAEVVERVLRLVGMTSSIDKMPAALSGGQRKRVALARAIVLEPQLVLYDEPTTGLDPIRSDVINELIIKLKRELSITGIVVTHDLVSAFKVADMMVMLYDGQIVLQGSPDVFRHSPDEHVQRFLRGEATADELAEIRAASPNGAVELLPDA